jgi:hypothetical protein
MAKENIENIKMSKYRRKQAKAENIQYRKSGVAKSSKSVIGEASMAG